ncbi:MAG TPA: efflux RND transporter periplasmic adaptor subunit [Gammaproteobacteria bacterium]|jgi:RND family efflux transporter MFP subunit|nr:efflux RND transporter periplasmic adaptor subunit [Gammaproteobacteria bacterium]
MLAIRNHLQIYLLLGLLVAGAILLWTAPDPEPELQAAIVPRVFVARVGLHDLVPEETVSGRLDPARRAALHFELSGQVEQRAVEPGQSVAAGDLLLALSAGDYADALAEAEAQHVQETRNISRDRELLALARKNYALQKNDLARLEQLGAESLVSKSHLDEVRIQLIRLESEVAQLKASTGSADARLALKAAARNRAARNLERARLQAPFAGTVNSVHVQSGDYVTPSQTVVELVDASSLDLYVEVRGNVAQSLSQGQAVTVSVNGLDLPGEVIALQLDPDPVTFTHALRVRLAGNNARPGQVAQVRLPLQARAGVTAIPSTAVLFEEGHTYVYRVLDDTLEQVAVSLGERVDDLQIVLAGIHPDDVVVTRDVAALSDGQTVTIEQVAPAVAGVQPAG